MYELSLAESVEEGAVWCGVGGVCKLCRVSKRMLTHTISY